MSSAPLFRDRADAGEQLAKAILTALAELKIGNLEVKPIVYGLPKGGLPLAAKIASCLDCPLDFIVAKKITRPENPELAIGAVTADGEVIWSKHKPVNSRSCKIALAEAQEKAQQQLDQLSRGYPDHQKLPPPIEGAIGILVDDGIATGMTMMVAAQALSKRKPAEIWICTPVAPPELIDSLMDLSDRLIILATPAQFFSVSRFYEDFPQVEIAEALFYLQQHQQNLSTN